MRIPVEPSAHHLLDAGDAATLQMACERLSGRWPGAALGIITLTGTELEQRFAGAGLQVAARTVTNRGRTWIWLWRANA